MNQKGFTFIELIAIVLVLAAICLVSFPTILNMAKKSDKNVYEEYKNTICLAAKTYVTNKDKITDSTELEISIKDLVDLNYIEGSLMNPKTETAAQEEEKTVTIVVDSDNSIDCIYNE